MHVYINHITNQWTSCECNVNITGVSIARCAIRVTMYENICCLDNIL